MNVIINTEIIQAQKFNLAFNENNDPVIIYKNKTYQDLNELIREAPVLHLEMESARAVKIVSFLLYGLRYEVIENIKDFQEKYKKKQTFLKEEISVQNLHNASYGNYDISGMRSPKRAGNQWVFYVIDTQLGVPYKVSFILPSKNKPFTCGFTLLPFRTA